MKFSLTLLSLGLVLILVWPRVIALNLKQYTSHSNLTHVAVDTISGQVIAGGVNLVASFDADLNNGVMKTDFGPHFDSEDCFGEPAPCSQPKGYVDNSVMVLEINSVHNYALVCGSVWQGLCSLHPLSDIKSEMTLNATNHASFLGSKTSSVAFFGMGKNVGTKSVRLYAAVSTYNRTKDEFAPHSISTRIIVKNDGDSRMEYLKEDISPNFNSYLTVSPLIRKSFKVHYLYGFEHNGYGYYVAIQPLDMDVAMTKYVTKLIEFCLEDDYYWTYIEMPLICHRNDVNYTLATAAYIGTDGMKDYLAVSFGRHGNRPSREPDSRYGSVVCNFSMENARNMFGQIRKRCSNGGSGSYPEWIYGYKSDCKVSPNIYSDYNDYCAYDKQHQYRGISADSEDPGAVLFENADVCVDEMITSLVTTTQMSHPITVLGTADGHLLKVAMFESSEASLKGGVCEANIPYMRYKLSDDGTPIGSDMELDGNEDHLYVITGKTLSKFPLNSCEVYSECSSCVSSHDPLGCGWCMGKCTKRGQCNETISVWSHDTCKPYISSISPKTGPTAGGTLLTITGNNFGNKDSNVFIGDSVKKCAISFSNNTVIVCNTYTTEVEGSFPVTVEVRDLSLELLKYKVDGSAKTTTLLFEYKTPTLESVTPTYGPEAGGTQVTVVGTNFNVGLHHKVMLGTIPCDIQGMNMTVIQCLTQRAPTLLGGTRRSRRRTREYYINVNIDGASLTYDEPFQYKKDSEITAVHPGATIHRGGTKVTITGSNLNIVQRPELGIIIPRIGEKAMSEEPCVPNKDGTKMICIMPSINEFMGKLDQTQTVPVSIFFKMDGITSLGEKEFPTNVKLSRYLYYENPKLYKFEGDEMLMLFDVGNEFLSIKGEHLQLGLQISDYTVIIGKNECNMSDLGDTVLQCVPVKPGQISDNEPRQAVEVKVGSYLSYDIGQLIYVSSPVQKGGISLGIIVLIVILILLIAAIILLFVIMKKRRIGPFRDKSNYTSYVARNGPTMMYDAEGQLLLDQNRANAYAEQGDAAMAAGASPTSTGIDENTRLLLQDHHLLIDRQFLQMGEVLGAGHFGSVYKGFLTVADQKVDELVAVKTLHQNSPREIDVQSFLKEALIMKDFDHKNVLRLIGICLGMDDMPLVVLPYMVNGDLLSYIRNEQNNPTIKDLINFSIDISDGMTYLSELKFVHRDLACRNCMLDENFRAVVADFGLSRDVYEKDYYSCESKKTMLPVKWMALECLEKGKYSSKSDVWSFGIVLWELLTRGVNPYPDVDNWDIVRYLKGGRRMPQPQYCPDHLYKIMRKCWLPNPKDRPTFSQINHEIKDMITMLEQATKQGEELPDIQTTYVNMDNCTDYHYTDELMPPPDSDDESSAPTSPRSPTSPTSPMSPKSPVQPQSPTAESSGATGTSADLKPDTQTDTKTDTNIDSKSDSPKEKPKNAQELVADNSAEAGDPSETPLLGEKETTVVQPGKTGLTDSRQGDSQA